MFQMSEIQKNYPAPAQDGTQYMGLVPVDFIIEVILEDGLDWFRSDTRAPNWVYGNLLRPTLKKRYGQTKIDEITQYIKDTNIKVTQSFPTGAETSPSISINLANAAEHEPYAGMDDFAAEVDVLGGDEDNVVGRTEIGYSPIRDDLIIGVHAVGYPDKVKFIHQLVVFILNAFEEQIEQEGLFNITFRSTDLSRLNEYLPQNMFSRFVTFSAWSFALIPKGDVPILRDLEVNVEIDSDFEIKTEIGG